MVLIRALAAAVLVIAFAPVEAHKAHQQPGNATSATGVPAESAGPASAAASATRPRPAATATPSAAVASKQGVMRLIDWIGRLHPIVVHFPLAFFPAALFTALAGRRRPAYGKPVQFLIVAGGLLAPLAAMLGWLDGGFVLADADRLLRVHRWLGTAIGIGGLALAAWAIKHPEEDRRPPMLWALGAITAAIIVQGWYGGAMIHGVDHLDW